MRADRLGRQTPTVKRAECVINDLTASKIRTVEIDFQTRSPRSVLSLSPKRTHHSIAFLSSFQGQPKTSLSLVVSVDVCFLQLSFNTIYS